MTNRVMFTAKVDHRYAWIGNDANGDVDILTELLGVIQSATTSIAVSTMTFNFDTEPTASAADLRVRAIADALAQKAAAGVEVRLFGNAGHRFQAGYFRVQRGPVLVADNNLSALVHRISFQSAASAAPAGYQVDSGQVFGPRTGGVSFGWGADVSADVQAHGSPDGSFTGPLLRECYAKSNSAGPRTWSIALPAGFYYVLVVTGEAAYGSKSFVLAQGQTIFTRKVAGAIQYFESTNTAAGEFACSTVDGGTDQSNGLPLARRLEVTAADGQLHLEIGKAGQTGYSSVCAIEIYRASGSHPHGDPGLDPAIVQERALHHTKFVLVDALVATRKLWTGSHNLTPVDPTVVPVRSEDAFVTQEAAICDAFLAEMNQWWGAASGASHPATARTGIFKVPVIADGTMPSVIPGLTAAWSVRFSPSTTAGAGVDLYDVMTSFLGPAAAATEDVLFLQEQVTDSGTYSGSNGTFSGASALVAFQKAKVLGGTFFRGAIGDSTPTESIFTSFAGLSNAGVASLSTIHDKAVLVDTLRDNSTRARGKVLFGSMNFSQGGMHVNDEQTLIIHDPGLANQFLQRAAVAMTDAAVPFNRAADCVVVLDRSYSMTAPAAGGTTKIAAARSAAKLFIDLMEQDGTQRLALVRFGAVVEPFTPSSTLAPLTAGATGTAAAAKTAIDTTDATLPIGASTCYGLALQAAQSLITSSAAARRMIVFLTDGRENTAPMAATVYPALAAAGVELHTTSFGPFSTTDVTGPNAVLAEMARASGGTFAQVDDDALHLQKRFAQIARDSLGMITILDPTFLLGAGQAFFQQFPVDMVRGTLVIALLWGGQAVGPEAVKITTPWGATLTANSAGVERRSGDGRDVWRIRLDALARVNPEKLPHQKAPRRSRLARYPRLPLQDVRGAWAVAARAPKRTEGTLRVDVCAYASDTGPARVNADLGVYDGLTELRVRPFAGPRPLAEAEIKTRYSPPSDQAGRQPRVLELTKVSDREPHLRGVQRAVVGRPAPGLHQIDLVVEGQVPVDVDPAVKPGTATAPKLVRFRRELRLCWFVGKGA
ncbi:MAG TPA: phospholipase D-like domain-containing protein [Kofleriaceae bacterium]|jgi:phosphatidylserine/phosphatidylglycerophosphate/cardiolipin synthase-like enzyme|nr:phospholipase D-like domain-containing protein [Kofleriaceae bacterium]